MLFVKGEQGAFPLTGDGIDDQAPAGLKDRPDGFQYSRIGNSPSDKNGVRGFARGGKTARGLAMDDF
jgi:hypothetical protein